MKIRNRAASRNSEGDLMVMARNVAVVIVGPDGVERAVHRVQYGARLKVDEGDEVKRGQRIAEWDPYTRPILTEVPGTIGVRGSCRRQLHVGGGRRVDRHRQAHGHRLALNQRSVEPAKPAIVIKGKDGKIAKLARGGDARYTLPVDSIIAVDPGSKVAGGRHPRPYLDRQRQDPRHHGRSAARGGAVRGAPSEGPRDHRGDCRHGAVRPRLQEQAAASRSCRTRKVRDPVEYLIPKGKHVHLQDGDVVEKGDYIVDGNPAPHDILAIKGVEELAAYLVNEIQEVYRLQGVNINDKHIEVIVRQMLQKVDITDPGDTEFLPGEQVDQTEMEAANVKMVEEGLSWRLALRSCSASPRLRCRRARSSPPPRSRKPHACSPRRPSTARSTRWKGSRRTSSSDA